MNLGTRSGALVALVGVGLINFGLFTFVTRCRPGVPCPSPSFNAVAGYLGLVLLILGVVILIRSGWRGSATSWVFAAAAVVPATWFGYELARQGVCPLLSDPAVSRACLTAYGEMTAPVLSFSVASAMLLIGWVRGRLTRPASDIHER